MSLINLSLNLETDVAFFKPGSYQFTQNFSQAQFVPTPMTDFECRYRDRASGLYKTLCTLTCNLLAINLVPRHS